MSHQPRLSPRLPRFLQSTEPSRARSISPEKQAKRNRARASSLTFYTSSVDDTNSEAEVTYTPPRGRIDKSFEGPPPVTAKGSASKTPKQSPKQSIASSSVTKKAPLTITKTISSQEEMGQTKVRAYVTGRKTQMNSQKILSGLPSKAMRTRSHKQRVRLSIHQNYLRLSLIKSSITRRRPKTRL